MTQSAAVGVKGAINRRFDLEISLPGQATCSVENPPFIPTSAADPLCESPRSGSAAAVESEAAGKISISSDASVSPSLRQISARNSP
jgi:hypothetical protein